MHVPYTYNIYYTYIYIIIHIYILLFIVKYYRPYFAKFQSILSSGQTGRVFSQSEMQWK